MRIFMRRHRYIRKIIEKFVYNVPRLLFLGIIFTFFVFAGRIIYDLLTQSLELGKLNAVTKDLPYATDDEPFLHLVDKTYKDEDLHEWEPATYNGTKPGDPGHLGTHVVVPPELQEIAKKRFPEHQINVVANEMMSYNRTLPDSRHPNCRSVEYPKRLPQTSVIIIFHNEAFSVLMRTVWNIYSKSPRALVKEIILVDDASDHEELGKKLDDYVKTIPVKVVVLRMMKRAGLIQAKILAAKYVTAPVMTFLDAHMEMIEGWLEPLLTIVSQDRATIANPVMDHLRYDSMEFISSGFTNIIGMFDWSFVFNWMEIPERERIRTNNDPTAPLRMPAMVGGLFSIDREFFYKLGTYDGGMKIWAGDDIEMSIRTWSCGGSILLAPCSRMGHLTRAQRIYVGSQGWFRLLVSNSARMIDAWADEWSEYFYALYPNGLEWRTDVTERKKLRKQLKCKSFKWFLEHAYPESTLNLRRFHFGFVESTAAEGRCLGTNGDRFSILNQPLDLVDCLLGQPNHLYILTERHEIRNRLRCLDGESPEKPPIFKMCHNKQGSQKFAYINETRAFEFNDTGYCLNVVENGTIVLKPCDGSVEQEWDLVTITR